MDKESVIGISAGVIGGMYKWITLQAHTISMLDKLTEAGVTAAICGVIGLVVKDVYQYGKEKYKARKKK